MIMWATWVWICLTVVPLSCGHFKKAFVSFAICTFSVISKYTLWEKRDASMDNVFLIHFLLSPVAVSQHISVNCYLKAKWCGLEDDALELKGTWLLKSACMSETILRERQERLLKAMLLMTKSLQESEKTERHPKSPYVFNYFISRSDLSQSDRLFCSSTLFAFWSQQNRVPSLWCLSAWNLSWIHEVWIDTHTWPLQWILDFE